MMKLNISQAIRQGLGIAVSNPVILLIISAYALLLTAVGYFTSVFFGLIHPPYVLQVPETLMPIYFLVITSGLLSTFLLATIARMVYDAIEGNVSLSQAARIVARKYIFLIAVSVLVLLIVLMGTIALIIPGIFLLVKLTFYSNAIVIDNQKFFESLRTSWQITKGNWWRIFALFLLFFVTIMILSGISVAVMAFSVPASLVIDFVTYSISGLMVSVFTIAYIQLTRAVVEKNAVLEQEKINF